MLDKDGILVIDNVFGPQVQDTLLSWLIANDSPWFFSKDIAFADDVIDRNNYQARYGFSKTFFSASTKAQTPLFNTVFPLLLEACDKINFVTEQVLFSRSFLTVPIPNTRSNVYDHIHVDLIQPHIVSLYYANDSDGDTVFFNECISDYLDRPDIVQALENIDYSKSGPGTLEIVDSMIDKSKFTVLKRVTPKKGRMVFFNGNRYHTATRPSSGYRIVVNSNLTGFFRNE